MPGSGSDMLLRLILSAWAAAGTTTSGVEAVVTEASTSLRAPVGFVVVGREGERQKVIIGGLDPDRAVPVASASKWVTAILVMTCIERGELGLDSRVGDYLPELGSRIASVTLEQLMSHRAAIDPDLALRSRDAGSLAESVREIAAAPPIGEPGKLFAYGGSSMQVAALMAERATGRSWQQLYEERLARPLKLSSGRWGHPLAPAARAPQVAGGLSLSLSDYARFLQMVLRDGELNGVRILTAASIRRMERDLTGSVAVFRAPEVVPPSWRYGFGLWCEDVRPDRSCSRVSSPGAFGTYPFIDRERDVAGLFFTRSQLPRVMPFVSRLQALALSEAKK
jgi:CubicO group peptidase (beta-lactamase class C family)